MNDLEIPARVHDETVIGANASFIWYCIPKNASRSILKAVLPHGRTLSASAPNGTREHLLSLETPGFSFAFVRNPYERIASAWRNKIFAPPDSPSTAKFFARWPGLKPGMAINEFVRWMAEQIDDGIGCDNHWRPQHQFVCNNRQQRCVDFVGSMDHLSRDWEIVRAKTGLKMKVGHLNATNFDASDLFSKQSINTIHRIYDNDFMLLGYAKKGANSIDA